MCAVPSAAPEDVQLGWVNTTAAYVGWTAPPPQHHNGILLGYKVSWSKLNWLSETKTT